MSEQEKTQVPRKQLENAKYLLEYYHGMALDMKEPEKAYAYYEALEVVDMALESDIVDDDLEFGKDEVEASRKARSEGYVEGTLMDERFSQDWKDRDRKGVLAWLTERFA